MKPTNPYAARLIPRISTPAMERRNGSDYWRRNGRLSFVYRRRYVCHIMAGGVDRENEDENG